MVGINELLHLRGLEHGDFTDQARITQELKDVMHATPNWEKLSPIQKEALEMNVHKIARILAGNPDSIGHWEDIAGYATLVVQRITLPPQQPDDMERKMRTIANNLRPRLTT